MSELADKHDGVGSTELHRLIDDFPAASAERSDGSNDRHDSDNAFQTLHGFSPLVKRHTIRSL
jgi:hypothetical protein